MTDEIEAKARKLGWQPKDEFKGNPDGWVEAKDFVERGETMLPLVKAANRRLEEKVEHLTSQLTENQKLLQNAQESIDGLKEYNSAENRKSMQESRLAIVEQIKEARTDGNVESEIELGGKLREVDEALRESSAEEGKPPKKNGKEAEASDPTQTKEFKEWMEANPWFQKDRRRTGLAMGIADEVRQKEPDLKGRAFLDRVAEEVEAVFGAPAGKVETGGRPPSSGGKKGTSYEDLPTDAKTACNRMVGRLVGPGRAYKTESEWRSHYATDYFSQEQQ